MAKVVGQTRDAGFQLGVSRTLPYPKDVVWDFLLSEEGLAIWLGSGVRLSGEKGESYRSADGTAGEVRSLRPGDRVRLTCRPAGWTHDTTVQVTVAAAAAPGSTSVRFHQEWLADARERARQRAHWQEVIDRLAEVLREAA